jgi:hypothetical protein
MFTVRVTKMILSQKQEKERKSEILPTKETKILTQA